MWIIERNVFPHDEEERLVGRLAELNIPAHEVTGADLRRDLPTVDAHDIVRGSCWFILQCNQSVYWRGDVWGCATDFSYAHYAPRYCDVLLNYPYRVVSFHELCWVREELFPEASEGVFVRPDDGFKSLEGRLVRFDAFEQWITQSELLQVRGSAPLIVALPRVINAEWRLIIADKDIVASSQYRPHCHPGCPDHVRQFVTEVTRTVEPPCRVYVMDIADTPIGPRVVEVGCIACVAFYEANEKDIIERLATL